MVFFLAIILSIPIAIFFILYRWINKIGYKRTGLLIVIVLILLTAYEAYTAIYPTDDFYFDEFKKITFLEIPASAKVIEKTASYPDFHGDYVSCALIKLSSQDFKELLNTLRKDKNMIKNFETIDSEELRKIIETNKVNDIKESFSRNFPNKDYYSQLSFFNDNERILVYFLNP